MVPGAFFAGTEEARASDVGTCGDSHSNLQTGMAPSGDKRTEINTAIRLKAVGVVSGVASCVKVVS